MEHPLESLLVFYVEYCGSLQDWLVLIILDSSNNTFLEKLFFNLQLIVPNPTLVNLFFTLPYTVHSSYYDLITSLCVELLTSPLRCKLHVGKKFVLFFAETIVPRMVVPGGIWYMIDTQ